MTDYTETKAEGITIFTPNQELANKIVAAINLVKKTDSKSLTSIKKIKLIWVTKHAGSVNELFMPERFWFTDKTLITGNDLNWVASLLVHEAYHINQYETSKTMPVIDRTLELPALLAQKDFLNKLNDDFDVEQVLEESYGTQYDNRKITDPSFRRFRKLLAKYNKEKGTRNFGF